MAADGRFARSSAKPRSRYERALVGSSFNASSYDAIAWSNEPASKFFDASLRSASSWNASWPIVSASACCRWKISSSRLASSVFPMRLNDVAERVARFPQARVQGQRAFERDHCVCVIEPPDLHLTGRGVCLGITRIEPRRRHEFRERFLVASLEEVDLAKLAMGLAAIGIGLDAASVRRHGAVEVGLVYQQTAKRTIELIATDDRPEGLTLVNAHGRLRQQRLSFVELRKLIANPPGS